MSSKRERAEVSPTADACRQAARRAAEQLAWMTAAEPAPVSTRTGDEETEEDEPVATVLWYDPEAHIGEKKPHKIIDASMAFMEAAEIGTKLYARPLAARPASPEAQGAWRSQAADDVLAERRRQVEIEGWTPEHDDHHSERELGLAAACYATAPSPIRIEREWTYPDAPANWPWCRSWWKPKFYRRNLVKAAALLIAEIERWDRLEARTALAHAATAREG